MLFSFKKNKVTTINKLLDSLLKNDLSKAIKEIKSFSLEDINQVDENGNNILHDYFKSNCIEREPLELLLSHGVDYEAVNRFGQLPIDLTYNFNLVKVVLKKYIDSDKIQEFNQILSSRYNLFLRQVAALYQDFLKTKLTSYQQDASVRALLIEVKRQTLFWNDWFICMSEFQYLTSNNYLAGFAEILSELNRYFINNELPTSLVTNFCIDTFPAVKQIGEFLLKKSFIKRSELSLLFYPIIENFIREVVLAGDDKGLKNILSMLVDPFKESVKRIRILHNQSNLFNYNIQSLHENAEVTKLLIDSNVNINEAHIRDALNSQKYEILCAFLKADISKLNQEYISSILKKHEEQLLKDFIIWFQELVGSVTHDKIKLYLPALCKELKKEIDALKNTFHLLFEGTNNCDIQYKCNEIYHCFCRMSEALAEPKDRAKALEECFRNFAKINPLISLVLGRHHQLFFVNDALYLGNTIGKGSFSNASLAYELKKNAEDKHLVLFRAYRVGGEVCEETFSGSEHAVEANQKLERFLFRGEVIGKKEDIIINYHVIGLKYLPGKMLLKSNYRKKYNDYDLLIAVFSAFEKAKIFYNKFGLVHSDLSHANIIIHHGVCNFIDWELNHGVGAYYTQPPCILQNYFNQSGEYVRNDITRNIFLKVHKDAIRGNTLYERMGEIKYNDYSQAYMTAVAMLSFFMGDLHPHQSKVDNYTRNFLRMSVVERKIFLALLYIVDKDHLFLQKKENVEYLEVCFTKHINTTTVSDHFEKIVIEDGKRKDPVFLSFYMHAKNKPPATLHCEENRLQDCNKISAIVKRYAGF